MCVSGCQEAEQKRLELEMQKRRERIEQWRAARKAKQDTTAVAAGGEQAAVASRKWTLEDEEDEDATETNDSVTTETTPAAAAQNGFEAAEEEEDIDPLDAYMQVHTTTLLLHTFNGPLSGTTQVSRYQKGKTNLNFTEANDSEWQWHPLGHMQVCTLLQTDNHASTPPLSFFTGQMPFLPPNQQRQSTEGRYTHTHTKPFNGPLSGTTRVVWYQKKHSPTHTHRGHQTSFINFIRLL